MPIDLEQHPDEMAVNGEQDLFLEPSSRTLWISVGPFSVHVIRADEGLIVDVYPRGREMDSTVASLQVFEGELEEDDAGADQG